MQSRFTNAPSPSARRFPSGPDLAVALKDLADDYYQLGRYADAEPLHKRALR
jgi:Tetratricopeptide repeat